MGVETRFKSHFLYLILRFMTRDCPSSRAGLSGRSGKGSGGACFTCHMKGTGVRIRAVDVGMLGME